jgi:hypothetical protein
MSRIKTLKIYRIKNANDPYTRIYIFLILLDYFILFQLGYGVEFWTLLHILINILVIVKSDDVEDNK